MLEAAIAAKRLPSGALLLRNVALAAGPGKTLALLGASGVGKTTVLRILLGLDRQFEGSVRRNTARVGAVFQDPRLLPWRTVGENMRLVAPAADVGSLLAEVALPPATAALHPGQLSLGMARRVALARALAIRPELLVLDEPFASLDPGSAETVAACLARAAREGVAVVAAMHDLHRAVALATRIVVLAGRPATVAHQLEPGFGPAVAHAELARLFPFLSAQPHAAVP